MKQINKYSMLGLALATILLFSPLVAKAGNVGWNVSVGGGYGGYGGGWRPGAYGPGWGPGWRGNWAYGGGYYGGGYYGGPYAGYYAPPVMYAPPPVVTYMPPPQPMVLAAQPQAPVWYYCEASGKFFPYVQECASGWKVQPAAPPTSSTPSQRPQH